MFGTSDTENFSQVMQEGRRVRVGGKATGIRNQDNQNNGPFYVTSPLNKSKQDVFS